MGQPTILVTGGAGFIGSHLSRALVALGFPVIVYDNLSMGRADNVPRDARLVKADLLDAAQLASALAEAEVVFHLAARVSIRASVDGFYDDAQTNLLGTLNLLRALPRSGVKKVVFASSMAVYADCDRPDPLLETYATEPISPYGIAKLAAEKYILLLGRQLGIKVAALRYFNTYGPGQTYTPYVGAITIFVNRLLAGHPPIIFGSGEQRRDFVSVRDVVDATIAAMRWDGDAGVFNVGSGHGTSVNEVADLLIRKLSPGTTPIRHPEQPGEIRNSVADITRARTLLGFTPTTRLEDALDEIIASNRNPGAVRPPLVPRAGGQAARQGDDDP